MSQKTSRASGAVMDDKEKRKVDSPVKDMKKKLAVMKEKEIPPAEKQANGAGDKKTITDKQESGEKGDKKQEKKDKHEKKETKEASGSKPEKGGKPEPTPTGSKQNGSTEQSNTQQITNSKDSMINGKDANENGNTATANGKDTIANGKETIANGKDPLTNGSNGNESKLVSDEEEDLIDDELFPELRYDDSDLDNEMGDVRSVTRRSQVKATKTPETPRPASDTPQHTDHSKDKVLKMTETVPAGEKTKPAESGTNGTEEVVEDGDVENGESRKPDTNFSKSRVKISPYRRSMRLADQTTSSTAANYTGNNTTMEMDITESSIMDPTLEESTSNEDSFVHTIRSIRGRRSYKQLGDMNLSALSSKSARDKKLAEKAAQNAAAACESRGRPTSVVVGRKRGLEEVERGTEAVEDSKRSRLFGFAALAHFAPFNRDRRTEQMIVGVNTDLPMSIPVVEPAFDPETLKTSVASENPTEATEVIVTETKSESKKCIVM